MTRFHADEYINFLKTITPEIAQDGQPYLRRCMWHVLHWVLYYFQGRGLGSCFRVWRFFMSRVFLIACSYLHRMISDAPCCCDMQPALWSAPILFL